MWGYFVSLLLGILVGVIYASVGVRSPAPPAIALLGLLGMLIGENGAAAIKKGLDRPITQITAKDVRAK